MRKTLRTLIAQIRRLEARRRGLLGPLLLDPPLLQGSLSRVMRRCGKSTCHCARAPAHPVWVLGTSRAARRRCQVVRLADVQEVRRLVERYRVARSGLRELEATQNEVVALLRGVIEKRHVPYE